MSNAKSNYLENASLNHNLGTATFTKPTATYLGLFTSDPTDAASGTEVSGNGYAREDINFTTATTGSATGPVTADGAIEFTASGGNWGTITHFAIYDALSGGNMLYYGQLSDSNGKTVTDGDSLRFAVDSITITEA